MSEYWVKSLFSLRPFETLRGDVDFICNGQYNFYMDNANLD